jgi:hypothetical protein
VLRALGLELRDFFPEGDHRRNGTPPKRGRARPVKSSKTCEDKIILALTTPYICGLLLGPIPTTQPNEALGGYVSLVELLWDAYAEQGTHDAAQAAWLNMRPELEGARRDCSRRWIGGCERCGANGP